MQGTREVKKLIEYEASDKDNILVETVTIENDLSVICMTYNTKKYRFAIQDYDELKAGQAEAADSKKNKEGYYSYDQIVNDSFTTAQYKLLLMNDIKLDQEVD